MDILPCPFCGNSDIGVIRAAGIPYLLMYDDTDGVTVYDVRMIMNCGECNMHMIGPDGIADSIDDAEDTARILLTRQWNARWTPSDRGADELV